MAEVKNAQSAASLSNESMFDIMRNGVRLYNCTQGELMEPYMHVAAKTVKDIDDEFILGIGDNEQDMVRFTSVVAQLASYGDILKNYLMMRAEPWRKQSLFKGDSITEAMEPKSYERNKDFNWNGERMRVVDLVGVDSFVRYQKI